MNFYGSNFDNQLCNPVDHALLFKSLHGDGILSGCGVSVSGSTVTLQKGAIIAAGRVFGLAAAGTVTLTQSTGYARILAVIDKSQTASDAVFEQVYTTVQYADSAAGFDDLIQQDINGAGTTYQMELCVIALGATPSIISTCGNTPLCPSGAIDLTANVHYFDSVSDLPAAGHAGRVYLVKEA